MSAHRPGGPWRLRPAARDAARAGLGDARSPPARSVRSAPSALLAASGYLITRAAEHPPILYLTLVMVGVRAFALGRAALRYVDRLAGHDASFRQLAVVRTEMYRRLASVAPAGLGRHRPRRPADAARRPTSTGCRTCRSASSARSCPPASPPCCPSSRWRSCRCRRRSSSLVALVVAALVGSVVTRVDRRALATARPRPTGGASPTWCSTPSGRSTSSPRTARSTSASRTVDGLDAGVTRAGPAPRQRSSRSSAPSSAWSVARAVVGILAVGAPAGRVRGARRTALGAGGVRAARAVRGRRHASRSPSSRSAGCVPRPSGSSRSSRRRCPTASSPSPTRTPTRRRSWSTGRSPSRCGTCTVRWPGSPTPAVDGVSFDLHPGEVVVLAGAERRGQVDPGRTRSSGSSTTRARYTLDGVEAQAMHPDAVRARIGLIEQDPFVFDQSVRQNLLFARETATDDELLAVLDRVGLGDWVVRRRRARRLGGRARRARVRRPGAPPRARPGAAARVPGAGARRAHRRHRPGPRRRACCGTSSPRPAAAGRTVVIVSHVPVPPDLVTRTLRMRDGRLVG